MPAYPQPAMRMLRVYAFDPQASVELDTAVINDAIVQLPWESPWEDPLTMGPCNDYLEVIDYDPASGLFYAPVDLNHPDLLAQNGLPPAEGRPQFHQQMVFAVAMKTIRNFERALGRPIMWSREAPPVEDKGNKARKEAKDYRPTDFVKRLRIYPHALREANAYYSPEKCALLFGYFRGGADGGACEGWVFTCLSQDIVAHETTHAILHGMHRRSIEPTNVDSLAFHEAFADIVALFQHFTMKDVLTHQIANARGSLRGETLLTGLAQQFGEATGREGALRYALEMLRTPAKREPAVKPETIRQLTEIVRLGKRGNSLSAGLLDMLARIGEQDPGGELGPELAAIRAAVERESGEGKPPPETFDHVTEPHQRGSFLVAAIFDAFVTIYERRTADLMRIATGGSSPDGRELSPDLVGRLAAEAAKAADHVLRMCVRGLDYLPPVDMHFGEYLRGIITADADLVPDDTLGYRVAFAQAFRNRRITVPGCISMAPDSLIWERPDPGESPLLADERTEGIFASLLPKMRLGLHFPPLSGTDAKGDPSQPGPRLNLREESHKVIQVNQSEMGKWVNTPSDHDVEWEKLFGVEMRADTRFHSIPKSRWAKENCGEEVPAVEVHSVRVARRSGPDGQELHQLIVQLTQRRAAFFDKAMQVRADAGELSEKELRKPDFWFRGGATIHADLRDGRIRRVIRKRIDDEDRLEAQRAFLQRDPRSSRAARQREPFAILHRSESNGPGEWS